MHRFQIFGGIAVIVLGVGAIVLIRSQSGPSSADAAIMAGIDQTLPPDEQLQQAYDAKLSNDDYVSYKTDGSRKQFQSFREEAAIKLIRERMADQSTVPSDVVPYKIPVSDKKPTIDGVFADGEWDGALNAGAGIDGAETTLYLTATETHLYLACDAPDDTTEDGYDQFRFYYHLNLSPLLVNERIHVSKRNGSLGGIRQTKVRWKGAPASNDAERWKKYAISDWSIYQNAYGASSVQGHRRFEAVIDLAEAGLPIGKPFAAYAQVESDPIKDENGKFVKRLYLGQLGTSANPVWFVIEK